MPARSKFTATRRHAVLEVLKAGGSRREAAKAGGVDHATLIRWVARGQRAAPGTRFRDFYEAVVEAQTDPHLRVLQLAADEMEDDPAAAWRFLERREPGFAPTVPEAHDRPAGLVVIQLTLHESPLAHTEGDEDKDEQDD